MHYVTVILSLLCLPSLLLTQEAPAESDIPEITINSVSAEGTGCPAGTIAITISPDRTVVTLGFDEFQLGLGTGWASSDRQKTCNIHLNVYYPAGYSYAVIKTTYHGFATLDEGVNGVFETEYIFADEDGVGLVGGLLGLIGGLLGGVGELLGIVTRVVIPGGGLLVDGDSFTVSDEVTLEKLVRSPCEGQNADMLVKMMVELDSQVGHAQGSLTEDDATIALEQQMHLEWKKCE
ncbi:DUF4360 domain-containing protein [Candidatus Bathyarchaeota archaeon]|nr:DUF4360 domain-containing protein [Candidatus Bathyarchaeota archaeon]